jgi:hypothetical protein
MPQGPESICCVGPFVWVSSVNSNAGRPPNGKPNNPTRLPCCIVAFMGVGERAGLPEQLRMRHPGVRRRRRVALSC